MKQFWVFVRKEWLHILRDKRTLFILFGMPVAQILIFGFALSNEVKNSKIAILDHARDQSSRQLIERIESSKYFEIVRFLGFDHDIDPEFKKGEVKLVVVFPPRFHDDLYHEHLGRVQLLSDASDPNVGTTLVAYLNAILNDFQNEVLERQKLPYRMQLETRMIYNPQLNAAYNFVPGVMAMVLMIVCSLMTSVAIVREKEMGTMEVLLVSPIKPIWVILSKTVPYLFLSFVNISSILLLSYFVLDVPVNGSLGLLLLVSTLFIITSLSLGMFISSVASTQTAAMFGALVGLFLPTLMFSGFMFPIDNMPLPLQVMTNFIPAKWYFYIVKSVMIKGLGFSAIWKEVAILLGMTVVLVTVSIRKFDKRLAL
ncbi:MAG TPA: ABC transporter permease [Saprospiraceae bacterium]|nr:ABC transporter permease [Saprospiraceae bacterium]